MFTDYRRIADAIRKDACGDYPQKCPKCGARRNCGSIRIHKAAEAIDQLVQIHQLDLSEISRLRRLLQKAEEESEAVHA